MNKIEQIEKEIEELIKYWKYECKETFMDGNASFERLCINRAIGLESALTIIKRASNTQINIDELYQCPYEKATRCRMDMPCKGCETWAANQ